MGRRAVHWLLLGAIGADAVIVSSMLEPTSRARGQGGSYLRLGRTGAGRARLQRILRHGTVSFDSIRAAQARLAGNVPGLYDLAEGTGGGTGRTLDRALGLPGVRAKVLQNPEVNVQLGTAFVADLMRQTHGQVPQVLVPYNAGPARLRPRRRFPEARDPELFAERIPFDEAFEYVRVVQANAAIYRTLYPDLQRSDAVGA